MIFIDNLHEEYYDIDTCDIWSFEQEHFFKVEKDLEFAKNIIYDIESLLVKNAAPVYSIKLHKEGDDEAQRKYYRDIQEYRENVVDPERIFNLDYFFSRNDCYQYNTTNIIVKDQVPEHQFQFFFSLKLRQYRYALTSVVAFLDYQKEKNFQNNDELYSNYLTLILRQNASLFSEELIQTINEYLITLGVKIPLDTIQVRSFLLYDYEKHGNEYFVKNANGFYQAFTDLKHEKFIDQSTESDRFKNILSLRVIKPERRIRWTGRNLDLKWFVQILIDDLEKVKNPVTGRWKVTLHCFVNKNGVDFEKEEIIIKASGKIDKRKERLKEILSNL